MMIRIPVLLISMQSERHQEREIPNYSKSCLTINVYLTFIIMRVPSKIGFLLSQGHE